MSSISIRSEMEEQVGDEDALDLLLNLIQTQEKAEQQQTLSPSSPAAAAGDPNSDTNCNFQQRKDEVEIVALTSSDDDEEEDEKANSTSGSQATLKRKLPSSMTGKGVWDQIHKDNRAATASSKGVAASGSARRKSSFYDCVCRAYEVLKGDDKPDEEEAEERAFKVPRPRWWPPEGFK